MSNFEEVKVTVHEDPWKYEREAELRKIVESIKGNELGRFKNINQACDEIRTQCREWRTEISEMALYRYGETLWRKAQQWHTNPNADKQKHPKKSVMTQAGDSLQEKGYTPSEKNARSLTTRKHRKDMNNPNQ